MSIEILLFFGSGILVLLLVLIFFISTYNGLVTKRNRASNAWTQIDVQLKRRHDLIPNLLNTVKGYMAHERQLIEYVANARQQAIMAGDARANRAGAENALTHAVRSLFAVAEAYPALKADQNMRMLQEELSSTENRIGYARQFYNDAVMEYNTASQVFPANVVAGMFGFTQGSPFILDNPIERNVPLVQF